MTDHHKKSEDSVTVDPKKCLDLNLSPSVITKHQNRIASRIVEGSQSTFPVSDTCRLDNSGILKAAACTTESGIKIATFTPAAGVSSRYFSVFQPLLLALSNGEVENAFGLRRELIQKGVLNCNLNPEINRFFSVEENLIDKKTIEDFKNAVTLPKALQMASKNEQTFLDHKFSEHKELDFVDLNCLVIPPQRKELFENSIQKSEETLFYEQGPSLSTIRFNSDAKPITESDGSYSPVPAGHGALLNLFAQLNKDRPDIDGIFIRNIDNTAAINEKNSRECEKIANNFKFLLKNIRKIRQFIDTDQMKDAENVAEQIWLLYNAKPVEGNSALAAVQSSMFHTPPEMISADKETLTNLYSRPLTLLGQVPNLGSDIGGSPAFITIDDQLVKVCLERPHASSEDLKNFLDNPNSMTHFNPVFVFSEIGKNIHSIINSEHPFWLVAKKEYRGQTVFYHESILYELLGNSLLANALFFEISRSLFVPNKSIFDSAD